MRDWIRRWLGAAQAPDPSSDAVRRIAAELDALPEDQAKSTAAMAYVLGRVAFADRVVTPEESARMEEIVRERSGLPEAQAVLVVQMAKTQNRLFGATEDFLVTRELAASLSREERLSLLDSLFAIGAADDSISTTEEAVIRQIAAELGLSHEDYVEVRTHWSEKRAVLKGLDGS